MTAVSIVITVYNKADFLRATLASLLAQEGAGQDFNIDFILVDDASRDASIAVAEAFFAEHPARFTILRNTQNVGPSIRLNQGLHAATGEYIFVFDADDIAPCNVIRTMLTALRHEQLDYIYGRSRKTDLSAEAAAQNRLPDAPDLLCSNTPLHFTLQRGLVQPIVLMQRDLALRAGGSDERIFVQDESLALRLALAAKRVGLLEHPCRYVLAPQNTAQPDLHHLSANRNQQHHDQYLAYTHVLDEQSLTGPQRTLLARKAIAPWWKSARKQGFHPLVLLAYLCSKLFPGWTLATLRPRLDRYFAQLPNVRRINPA